MAFEEGLRGLSRKRHHKAIIRMRQVHRQIVRLLLNASDRNHGFAEVRLRLARRMHQRHEHLLTVQRSRAYVVLHDGVTTGELMLFFWPIENALDRVPLLGRPLPVAENGVDDAQPRPQLGPPDRLLPLIAWRHSVLQHLPYCLSRKT
jgi:hypothetical protein